jgi:hypothetical protein
MSHKRRKYEENLHPADGHFANMKFKDLKRECVIRGMDFDEVLSSGVHELYSFFKEHFYDDVRHGLLDEFDDWQEEKIRVVMEARGENPDILVHPALRLGYVAEKDDEGNTTKRKRAKMVTKKLKRKRERTNDNIFQGTKKAYTFELQQQGKDKKEVIKKVIEKYPDASEKSISIWFNKSKKLHKVKIGGKS